MKREHNKRSARISPKKIKINKGGKGLTAQAGLIPVVKFFHNLNLAGIIKETVDHQRGGTALYDVVDAIFLPLVAIIGGARSIRAIVTIWSDSILCRVAGWLTIPDETTFGRLFRTMMLNLQKMDLTIPGGMGGKEAIQKLIEIDPEIKAIVSSGYSTDLVMAEYKKYGFCDVVAKPYTIEKLSSSLHRSLN